jgi:DNA-binding MarR family transcriptional regulator
MTLESSSTGVPAEKQNNIKVLKEGQRDKLEFLEIYQLALIANRSSRHVAQLFEQSFSLQVTDWRVIALLVGEDYLPFKDIVERTGMEKSRISRAHVRLQKAGLIQVAEGPFDKRTLVIKLTPKGTEVMQKLLPQANTFNNWLLEALSEEEKNSFNSILMKLRERVKNIDLAKIG